MTAAGSISYQKIGSVAVFTAPVYFEMETGQSLQLQVEQLFQQGVLRFVVDFQGAKVITSPAVSCLMEIAVKVLDDYKGSIAFASLNALSEKIFTLVGILPLVPLVPTLEEALKLANA